MQLCITVSVCAKLLTLSCLCSRLISQCIKESSTDQHKHLAGVGGMVNSLGLGKMLGGFSGGSKVMVRE